MQAEMRNFHRLPRAPIGRVQGKIAVDKESNPIKEAEEMLKRTYARVQSIANAWELLMNREQMQKESRWLRIDGKKNFIEALNLPAHYEDGSPASKTNGTSVEEVENRHSICVSVQSVREAAIKANLPWPPLLGETKGESEEWSATELLEIFHKSNREGSTGPHKKSQRDLATEYGISQPRIGQLLDKADVLIKPVSTKAVNSVFSLSGRKVKDGNYT